MSNLLKRRRVRRRIWQSVTVDGRSTIEELTNRCERRHQTFRQKLDAATKAILIQDWQTATNHLIQARVTEADQSKDLYQLKQSEKRLINLTKTKLRKSK
jgi:predicted transcriptional regulator